MAEEKGYTQVPVTMPDGKEVTMFVDGGKPKPAKEFQNAIEQYAKGDKPKGFTIIEAGSVRDTIRKAYESGNVPLQAGAEKVSQAPTSVGLIERLTGKSLGSTGNFLASRVNPGTAMPMALYDALKGAVPIVAESVSTPTKAAATTAMLGTSVATGGTSGILPLLTRVAGTGAAAGAGSYFGGEASGPSKMMDINGKKVDVSTFETAARVGKQVLLGSAAAAAGEAATGVLRFLTNSTMSKRASAQVAEDVMNLIKKDFPQLANSGVNGLKAIGSTEKGAQQLAQIGVRGLRTSNEEIASQLVRDINQAAPRTLGKVTQRHLNEATSRYVDKIDDIYNSIGKGTSSKEAFTDVKDIIDEFRTGVGNVLKREFGDKVNAVNLVRIDKALKTFEENQYKLLNGAEVVGALRESGAKGGFDVLKFQQVMKDKLYSGSDLMESVGVAAGRGKPGGLDYSTKEFGIRTPLGKFGVDIPREIGGKVITKYSGHVRGTIPSEPANIAAIKEFLSERD